MEEDRRNGTRNTRPKRRKSRDTRSIRSSGSSKGSAHHDDLFLAYMRDVSRHPLLSVEQEQALANRLLELRANYWREALSYPPYVAAALDLVEEIVEDATKVAAQIDRLRKGAYGVRRSNKRAIHDEYLGALDAFAKAMAKLDTECVAIDRIAADLEQLESGQRRGSSMNVKPPRRGSKPFADYVSRVRRASAALRLCRNEFARANLRLVVRIASRFQRSGLSLHDRVQEGNIGLMKAVDRFDPTRGFRFSTYASWWIKHTIRRAVVNLGRTIRLPAHLQALGGKVARAKITLRMQLQREPTVEEIAAELDVPLDKVQIVEEAMAQRPVSLDAPVSEGDERSIGDMLATEIERTPGEMLDIDRATEWVRGTLLTLEPMERDILRQRFGLDGQSPRTLSEIGGQYSLSRERIRQLQQKALARIRARMDAHV